MNTKSSCGWGTAWSIVASVLYSSVPQMKLYVCYVFVDGCRVNYLVVLCGNLSANVLSGTNRSSSLRWWHHRQCTRTRIRKTIPIYPSSISGVIASKRRMRVLFPSTMDCYSHDILLEGWMLYTRRIHIAQNGSHITEGRRLYTQMTRGM